ncbi:MAG: hypothetical protein JNK85_18880 [Verrucomicrobiales bacterium]|nr:hypothetical protein [Verrucomicrobiales bacterium]
MKFSVSTFEPTQRPVIGAAVLMGLLVTLLPFSAQAAEIVIEGVADRVVYTDRAAFKILPPAEVPLVATLDGTPVAINTTVNVENADYHELRVDPAAASPDAPAPRLVRFIVRASARGDSEWGLPPWTPPPVINASAAELAGARTQWLLPARYPILRPIPFAVRLEDDEAHALRLHARLESDWHAATQLRRGWGAGWMAAPGELAAGTTEYAGRLGGTEIRRSLTLEAETSWTPVSGILSGDVTWPEHGRIELTQSITIPLGSQLRISRGTLVFLAPGVDITVRGRILIEGSADAPVVFAPAVVTRPWGGFLLFGTNASLSATQTLFAGSGANPSWFSQNSGYNVHRSEQALFLVDAATVHLSHCAAIDGAGQFGHGKNGFLTLDRCLVQRFITGGEYNGGSVEIRGSALIEFPVDDGIFDDADNDAIYLTNGRHVLADSVLGWAKDDGIDAGSGGAGSVLATNVWIEGNFHEAFAWSGEGRVVTNLQCVALHCGQGIECGWSTGADSPLVTADHCLVAGNASGFRFGDNYDWTYNGHLQVTNSLALFNHRDVFDLNWDDWSRRPAQMDLQGNAFSQPQPHYPHNHSWDPIRDAARLAPFLPRTASARVGLAFATRSQAVSLDQWARGIPVGLSGFSTQAVRVEYSLRTADQAIASGVLQFAPGETLKSIQLPPSSIPAHTPVRLQLAHPTNADLTGPDALYGFAPGAAPTMLLPRGARWRYLDSGTDPGPAWPTATFDDSAWKEGAARLGFGGDGEITEVDGGPADARFAALYFRHTLVIPDPSPFQELEFRVQRDDGALVHLNGTEAFRSNLPSGPVTATTYTGTGTDSESEFYVHRVAATALRPGTNVVAVEIHQANATSSDLGFDLEIVAHPAARLAWHRFEDRVLLSWDATSHHLQESMNVAGPWSDTLTDHGLHEVIATGHRFYRLVRRGSEP